MKNALVVKMFNEIKQKLNYEGHLMTYSGSEECNFMVYNRHNTIKILTVGCVDDRLTFSLYTDSYSIEGNDPERKTPVHFEEEITLDDVKKHFIKKV